MLRTAYRIYRAKIEKILNAIDQKITGLFKADTGKLVIWASRMKICVKQLRVLEKIWLLGASRTGIGQK